VRARTVAVVEGVVVLVMGRIIFRSIELKRGLRGNIDVEHFGMGMGIGFEVCA
jgi:hypothetical protein